MNELTQRGIAALKAGDRATARKLLASAVQQDMNDLAAWLWLAGALDGDDERITCLQQVLRLDPGNQAAARGLAQILERRTRPASMAAAAQPPAAQPPAAKPAPPTPVEPPVVAKPAAANTPEPPAPPPPANESTPEPPIPTASATTTVPEPPAVSKPAAASTPEPPAHDAWRGLTWDTAPAETSAAEAPQAETPVFAEDTTVGPAQIYAAPAEPWQATPSESYDWNAAAAAATGRAAAARAAASAPANASANYATANNAEANAETNSAVDMNALAAFSAPADPAAPGTAAGVPYQRKRSKESYLPMRRIFTTRPSMVPALLCFWLFFFGAVITGNLLAKNEPMKTQIAIVPQALMENPIKVQASSAFAMAMGLILELVVLYATLRIFTIRYELTNQTLTLRFRGKRARVPVEYIYNAECKQSFIQVMIGTGHLDLDLAVNGELAHVRLRDIPECKKRRDQIMYLVQDQI